MDNKIVFKLKIADNPNWDKINPFEEKLLSLTINFKGKLYTSCFLELDSPIRQRIMLDDILTDKFKKMHIKIDNDSLSDIVIELVDKGISEAEYF